MEQSKACGNRFVQRLWIYQLAAVGGTAQGHGSALMTVTLKLRSAGCSNAAGVAWRSSPTVTRWQLDSLDSVTSNGALARAGLRVQGQLGAGSVSGWRQLVGQRLRLVLTEMTRSEL